jgi:glycine/D-amino acid oxidase-like deaminating enzyme
MRIGIVGGGAAGLAAAHALARRGHTDVTVLEASERVGGKCCTFHFQGRSYELGAGALTAAYTNVRALLDEHRIAPTAGLSGVHLDLDGGRARWLPPGAGSWWRLGVQGVRLAAALAREPRLGRPGFDGLAPALYEPFAAWARARKLDGVARLIEPWFTGFGYGYLDEVAAAYVLKYARLFRVPIYELLDGGYQGLFEQVARGLDVRRATPVTRIVRAPDGDGDVRVETPAGAHTFDRVLLTCPLDGALAFLDATDDERALFREVRWNDYHVIAVELDRPPRARYGFFPANFRRERAGEPVFFYRRWLDRDLVLVYTAPLPGVGLDASEAAVARALAKLDRPVRRVHLRHAWRYFPHVSPDALRAGWYERVERLQGARRTYYAGELLAFTSVETVVAYSRALVERFF